MNTTVEEWAQTRAALESEIHEVDRNATEIWFHFYPLKLAHAFQKTDDPARLARDLRLDGNYRLLEQIETSHWFFYGHRYWPDVKTAIVNHADAIGSTQPDLVVAARTIAHVAASVAETDETLVLGIVLAGLMTLQQVGLDAFRANRGQVPPPEGLMRQSPADIVRARQKDDSQGIAGLWRGIKARYTVTFDERSDAARFPIINQQHLTTAAANDRRDYSSSPAAGSRRCIDGPIPVECRTASCGTCWIGVLGGADKLSPVEPLEKRRMREFGYITTDDANPVIRLACASTASGNVSIVIPTWNGFVGKL